MYHMVRASWILCRPIHTTATDAISVTSLARSLVSHGHVYEWV